MDNDLKRFISITESEEFDQDQQLISDLYPYSSTGYLLLELCCYHGAIDCFKFLRTNYESEITSQCLRFSFLGGNPEIMSECLKYQKPDEQCMEYAIISHNIDFVTFLMEEYYMEIDLVNCGIYNNLEPFLVYFDQTNNINKCFIYSAIFNLPSLCEYFILHGASINEKDINRESALYYAVIQNENDVVELLLLHGVNINEKYEEEETPLHLAARNNYKEIVELLLSHGANVNEKNEFGETALHFAVHNNSKEMCEFLLSHGANINEKDKYGESPLHLADKYNFKEIVELLLLHGANIDC